MRAPAEYGAAAIVRACVLALYLVTMAPSTAMWDTSEYIAAAYSFGLPHPPGNPFFVIIGHLFSLLPIASNVAARINVLAAVSSAAAAGLWFLMTEQILRDWLSSRWLRIAGAVLGGGHRSNGVHGVEPVRREREGLHGFTRRALRSCPGSRSAGRPTLTVPRPTDFS